MEAKASARFVRVTPMKARRVVNLIRGKQAEEALAILKIVASAVANARQKATQQGLPFREEELFISEAFVNEGPTMKRIQPRAQGRAYRINKRTSHITVVVATPEKEEDR